MKLKLLLPINRSAFFLKFIMHDFIFEIMEHINKPFLFIQLKNISLVIYLTKYQLCRNSFPLVY